MELIIKMIVIQYNDKYHKENNRNKFPKSVRYYIYLTFLLSRNDENNRKNKTNDS